jgi:hypothetical protein
MCGVQTILRPGWRAAYWRDVAIAEPSFIVVNPSNGRAHYVYLLGGWLRVDSAPLRISLPLVITLRSNVRDVRTRRFCEYAFGARTYFSKTVP